MLGSRRRKFHDIHVATLAHDHRGSGTHRSTLYAIEEEIRGKPAEFDCSVGRLAPSHCSKSLSIWMEKALRSLSTKSETAGAIRYALSHWRALTRYVDDGLLEIDNSAAERALRAVASAARIISSWDPIPAANAQPRSTASSARPSSTASIRNSISAPCWLDRRPPHQPHQSELLPWNLNRMTSSRFKPDSGRTAIG
jgi:hypothetical protein